ncbi:MAG: DUF1700 domain-containing protein [Clostridia bacterium]|nr:DUF1700 domain-containing protein [Clostridia bacterium]
MTKFEFLEGLRKGMSGLPQEDIEEQVAFYGEMIDDRVEDGIAEEEAVAQVGTVDEILTQIVSEIPLSKLVKEKVIPKRRLRAWEIILLALGSPIWLSLLIAVFAVLLSAYAVIWSLLVSLWAVEVSLWSCVLGGIISGTALIFCGYISTGFVTIAAGFICAGFSVFLFWGCKAATKGTLLLTKGMAIGIKNCFIKKEAA